MQQLVTAHVSSMLIKLYSPEVYPVKVSCHETDGRKSALLCSGNIRQNVEYIPNFLANSVNSSWNNHVPAPVQKSSFWNGHRCMRWGNRQKTI